MIRNMESTLSERMKETREAAGLSKAAFAKKMGVSRTTVTYWKDGTIKNVRPTNLFKAARIGNLSPEYIGMGDCKKTRTLVVDDVLNELALSQRLAVFDYIDYQNVNPT